MKTKTLTLDQLFEIVWLEHWSKQRFQVSGHARVVRANYEAHIKKTFGHLELKDVTRLKIRKWHSDLYQIATTANRALEVLSKLFSFAIDRELFDGGSPCFAIKAHRERKRKRYATEHEIERIGDILREYAPSYPKATGFLLTLIYTGARPRSIERAKWQNVSILPDGFGMLSFEGKSTAETGEEETVLLPPQVMDIMNSMPRRTDGLIFGNKMPRELWKTIRTKAGCPDLWARDLRRTFATVGMSNGEKMDTISELLNHKSVQTTKIYAKLWDTARVKAAKNIADRIGTLLTGTKVSNF